MLNRVYLDYYKCPEEFWRDLIQVFDNFDIYNYRKQDNDFAIIVYRMKNIAKFAFKEWKEIHRSDYEELKNFFRQKYSEIEFNEFTRIFYQIFSLKGTNSRDKFLEAL